MTATPRRPPAPSTDPRVLRSRAKVIATTLALLGERGIAATTIEAISERSGVAKTTIYRQWDDQPSLVLDAITSTLQQPPDPDTGTLAGDLHVLLAGLVDALTASPAAKLMPALIEAAEREPSFAALHRREADHRHRVVRDVILRGIDRGELPPDTDAGDVLDLLTGPIFYRRWVSRGSVDTAFSRRVVDIVLSAYSRPED